MLYQLSYTHHDPWADCRPNGPTGPNGPNRPDKGSAYIVAGPRAGSVRRFAPPRAETETGDPGRRQPAGSAGPTSNVAASAFAASESGPGWGTKTAAR